MEWIQIDQKMPYEALWEAVNSSSGMVKSGVSLIDQSCAVTKLSLARDPHTRGMFVMIFSMSRTIADGYTYYQIFNMLSAKSIIRSLSTTRKADFSIKAVPAIGEEQHAFQFSCGFICNALKNLVYDSPTHVMAYKVDTTRLRERKESEAGMDGRNYASTNDILTSDFANAVGATICILAVNLRGRLEGIGDNDAGNYEGPYYLS